MARSTQQIRELWEPHCDKAGRRGVSLLPAWLALDAVMRAHGYRPRPGECWGYNCRAITGGTGWSLHAYGPGEHWQTWTGVRINASVATDFNAPANPYGARLVTDMPRAMVDDILRIRTVNGIPVFRWGGNYSGNKDAMHYEIVVSPAELARGLDAATHPGTEDDMLSNEDLDKIGARVSAEIIRLTQGDLVLQHWHVELLERLDKIIAGMATTAGSGISPAKLARATKAFVTDLEKL